jgi:hypothetical protein
MIEETTQANQISRANSDKLHREQHADFLQSSRRLIWVELYDSGSARSPTNLYPQEIRGSVFARFIKEDVVF